MFLDRDSELKDISELYGDSFTSVHQDFIKEILYNNGWTSYEESGGLIVFEGNWLVFKSLFKSDHHAFYTFKSTT